jgi:hypothetical protein
VPTAPVLDKNTGQSIGGAYTYSDVIGSTKQSFAYRVMAINVVGDTWNYADPAINEIVSGGFPTVTTTSDPSNVASWVAAPAAPVMQSAILQVGPQVTVTWMDNATNEDSFVIERSLNGGAFSQIGTAPARNNTGTATFVDTSVTATSTQNIYAYRVAAVNAAGVTYSGNTASVVVPVMPAAPSNFTAANGPNGGGNSRSIILSWMNNAVAGTLTGFTIQRATNASFTGNSVNTVTVSATTTTLTQTGLSRNTAYYYRIRANNGTIIFSGWVNATPFPIITNP